jgi:tetraacyldisaccharide-1-P 4'-kinase
MDGARRRRTTAERYGITNIHDSTTTLVMHIKLKRRAVAIENNRVLPNGRARRARRTRTADTVTVTDTRDQATKMKARQQQEW